MSNTMRVAGVFMQRQCHCLKQKSTYSNSIVLINKVTRPSLCQAGGFQQRYYFHSLLRLKSKNIKQFKIYNKDINAYITRVSIGRSLYGQRTFTTQAIKAVMRLARVRYFIIGSVGAGAVSAKLTYNSWKDKWIQFQEKIPDLSWLKNILPDKESLLGDFLSSTLDEGVESFNNMFDRLGVVIDDLFASASPVVTAAVKQDQNTEDTDEKPRQSKTPMEKMHDRLEKSQDELINLQQRYQREIEKLEKDNRELRKQLIILKGDTVTKPRHVRKSLIDMYSDVLDLLAEYDANYNTTDNLPRVVVVGDQSAGKTSVLEMVAQARIFPRGSGQMMTRSPVMVTLSEGPEHIAQFKDHSRQYDLTQENELHDLRQEVELRMKNSVKKGQTVSPEVISMTVKGPGLHRMVLVDLPGIIGTETTGMAQNTKDNIVEISRRYMQNPNAIILCIQDGSIDAERSNVTDLVSSMDPQGKRTIFVLTKVDLAEKNEASPSRIKQILEGRLFPMKALGYFAVVTGSGNTRESIDSIRDTEEEFFQNSKFFKSGIFKASQMTTQNLSFAVSHCFWKMVKESIEQQADAYKAKKFNLETEWKNHFPKLRELDRSELFDKARGELLDEVLSLSDISPQQWEEILSSRLWEKVSPHFIEEIYLPAAQTSGANNFNTKVDIKLKQWADRLLPQMSVEVGWHTLFNEFDKAMQATKDAKMTRENHVHLFEDLKGEVANECKKTHQWQPKAKDSLSVIQLTALEDWSVTDKLQWEAAIKFMEKTLQEKLDQANGKMHELLGPGVWERWLYWQYRSQEEINRSYIKEELQRLLQAHEDHEPSLSSDEVTTVRKNLDTVSIQVDKDLIEETWTQLYREHFLKRSIASARECSGAFTRRDLAKNELQCNDVVLFWRIQKMLQTTSNALRQQIMNQEARRLEKEVKDVLDDIAHNQQDKEKLITGRQVELAEELKRVRHIQESLEMFIEALNKEK
ncbi:dynamin-like 120 kDa protein, mitochondrial isoform X2 [Exaiptasia diaphana]|uniref:Dynamin-like GTPase OPA1, mitochondrial n=1 Tax=Exaiptasia diaphana TaxID=2652724 RepID=A0A913X0X0_EXADI|nr:dynamin-like 120 kDa protein, mitochondrial isoform X2 [Exaiptasia diaphana]